MLIFMVTLGSVDFFCRCTEDGCPHKKFFHTRFLMRMRLTPDCSKMLISTSSGYLLILHDLDLTKSLEVCSYPILRARSTTSSSGELSFFDYRKSVLKNIKHGDDICFYSGNDSRKKGRKLKDILWKAQWELFPQGSIIICMYFWHSIDLCLSITDDLED